jgi:ATP-dependent Clp protease ATP-binding subunit ClpC
MADESERNPVRDGTGEPTGEAAVLNAEPENTSSAPSDDGDRAEPGAGAEADVLGRLGVDITEIALVQGAPDLDLWTDEISRVKAVLEKRERHAAMLVGPHGVGKRGLVFSLALQIIAGDAPPHVAGRRIIELPFHRILANVRQPGDFERLVFTAMRQAASRENIILLMNNFPAFLGVSGGSKALFDASYAVEMACQQPGLYLLGAATPVLYKAALNKLPWLEHAFSTVSISERKRGAVLALLSKVAEILAEYHGITIGDEAIASAVDLSGYYVKERVLPGKAMELLDEAAAEAVSSAPRDAERPCLEASHVAAALSHWIGIPPDKLAGAVNHELLELGDSLMKRVKGQDYCIRKLADVIRVSRLGLNANPQRPDGVFLFVGPSGVGKSELARALAEELYGSSTRLFEFNMTSYSDDDGLARLVGLQLGELNHPGDLTTAIERYPHSVIVFEQIERAHRDVAVMLMRAFRDGCIIDSSGEEVCFSNTVMIMTSNSENLIPEIEENGAVGFGTAPRGRSDERYSREVREAIEEFFPAEFMDGVDEVLIFDPLSDAALRDIVQIHLDDIAARLAERSVALEVTDEAVAMIVEKGHSREYGARNLGRTVEGLVLRPVARFLLGNPDAAIVRLHVVEGDIEVSVGADA